MLALQCFIAFIEQQKLFQENEEILLGVSGGKDSVLMTHFFKLAGYRFGIAHCNFNLRGAEAQRDELFVKLLADELDVPYHVVHFDTKTYAEQHRISIQMAARDLRYQWFDEIAQEHTYHYIALAQHQNDAIETLLLNLTRGTGIAGLHGILPKRNQFIRPLLFLNRNEIDEIIEAQKWPYVEDSSNLSDKYARNKIRLNVVPHLQEINPKLEETFAQNIQRFAEIETFLNLQVDQIRLSVFHQKEGYISMDKNQIKNLNPQKLLCYELLKPYHFSAAVVEEILNALDSQAGTVFMSNTHQVTIDRMQLVLSEKDVVQQDMLLIHGVGNYVLNHFYQLHFSLTDKVEFEKLDTKAYIDADQLIFPLVIRYRQVGDSFKPLGMKGFKKLSDFFVDKKVPLPEKSKIPLLVNGNGEIIWVVRMKQDERYKLSENTKKVAIFELLNL